jgi:hypothetical protein
MSKLSLIGARFELRKIEDWPVMKRSCPTCPFGIMEGGRRRDEQLCARIEAQALGTASQICHHRSLHGKPENSLCRGARNFQLMIFHRLGVIAEPTDKAWDETRARLGV